MRASELEGKEVIDVNTGDRLGVIQKSELLVNTTTGLVEALILTQRGWNGRDIELRTIPWGDIRKISDELVIISGTNES
ncbi:MAG TPA: YlmC/YmxH family sporulation protein [Firmicutes bacterium]|jgi:YlmC/YmxH family sporulation protein|nr:YlmC/YmxH family sporulation protein [Bacillota bacterium]